MNRLETARLLLRLLTHQPPLSKSCGDAVHRLPLLQKLGFVLEKTVAYSILPGIDVLQFRLSLVSGGAEVVA